MGGRNAPYARQLPRREAMGTGAAGDDSSIVPGMSTQIFRVARLTWALQDWVYIRVCVVLVRVLYVFVFGWCVGKLVHMC